MSLYRAFVSHGLAAPCFGDQTVFFDFPAFDDASRASAHLRLLLALIWDLPPDSLEIYNCRSEYTLRRNAYNESPSHQWDARLFETGWSNGGPSYGTEQPIFLVRPADMRQLLDIWNALPRPEAA